MFILQYNIFLISAKGFSYWILFLLELFLSLNLPSLILVCFICSSSCPFNCYWLCLIIHNNYNVIDLLFFPSLLSPLLIVFTSFSGFFFCCYCFRVNASGRSICQQIKVDNYGLNPYNTEIFYLICTISNYNFHFNVVTCYKRTITYTYTVIYVYMCICV